MKAKKKAPKVVKAWAYVHKTAPHVEAYPAWVPRACLRTRPSWRPAEHWRIARVEIREVGR